MEAVHSSKSGLKSAADIASLLQSQQATMGSLRVAEYLVGRARRAHEKRWQ